MRNNLKPTDRKPKRIDLHFDESGQHTRGEFFIIAGVMVAAENTDEARQFYASIEETSGKKKAKWASAKRDKRLAYLQTAIQKAPLLISSFFIAFFVKQRIMMERRLKVLQE